MTPENLRENWNKSQDSFSDFEHQTGLRLNTHTTLDRLADRYKRFAIISGIMIILIPLWVIRLIPQSIEIKTYMTILFAAYFLTAGSIDLWLYGRIKGLDISSAPVRVIIEQSRRCRKVHLRSMLLLIPFAILVVGSMIWCFRAETYMVYGMICGIAFGLLIGYFALQKFMNDYRILLHEYSD